MERSLSRSEARLVLDLEWRGRRTVTLAEIGERLGGTEGYARVFAHRLVRKGWFVRLRPGLFQLVPAERGREGVADTHPLVAGAVLVAPYFFSFGTACTHHGLTEQVFAEVFLACRERRPPATIRGTRYVFVPVPERRFFGHETSVVLGEPVRMATIERALLDAIDRPRHAGGLGEVSRIAARAARMVSWEPLLDLLERWQSSALVQRLGYYLDLHRADVSDSVRRSLVGLVRPRSKIQLGPRRRWGTRGRLVRPWNVVENVPREVLRSRDEAPGRRIPIRREEGTGDRGQVR